MNSINSFFEKVFVIALKEDANRVASINENLKGINFEFKWGVNMNHLFPNVQSNADLPIEFFNRYDISRERVLHWSKGGIGCGVSHRNVLKYIVENNIHSALILEDDVYLDEHTSDLFAEAIGSLPADWELLYLGFDYPTKFHKDYFRTVGPLVAKFKPIRVLQYDGADSGKNFFPKKVNKYFDRAGVYMGGHAYGVSLEGAKKLLTENTPMNQCADCLLIKMVYEKKIIAYNFREAFISQNKKLGSNTDGTFKL